MSEPRGSVLPIYFVADESGSMAGVIDQLNSGLVSLLEALQSEPMAAAKVRFCVMGFADNSVCYLEPADLRDLEDMPTLSARGSRSYAAAFRALRSRIPTDVDRLKSDGFMIYRPAVFFLTDGAPNPGDGWKAAHAELTDPTFGPRPNILAFGIGAANSEVIKQVATLPEYAFITANGMDTGPAIAEFVKSLTQSLVTSGIVACAGPAGDLLVKSFAQSFIGSGQALADDSAGLPMAKPEAFISLVVDRV